MQDVVRDILAAVVSGKILDEETAEAFLSAWMDGHVSPVQAAALVSVMAHRGEQPAEIAGFARAMRNHAVRLQAPEGALDTCGTGGDGKDTFNISTAVAFVAAAAGIPVAKHGNRAASSRSGSADVLQALGAVIDLPVSASEALLRETGLCFLFAQVYHPAMKVAAQVRKELGFRTIFNILGPLTNPAGAKRQVLGVFHERLVPLVGQALVSLESEHALVVHGAEGLDELSLSGPSLVAEVRDGEVRTYRLAPEDVGLRSAPIEAVRGGSPEENAEIVRRVLAGDERGAKRDIVLYNAGAALYVGGKAASVREGVALAAELIDAGRALAALHAFVQGTRKLARVEEAVSP
ncbi:anthranilate phosphoribosyltransferase [Alicyclobacillus sendaiensis]|uniref:Anthranilate phosphoribosyltransferase n=1 Tax=Alicyclobacillus sendaiensis PA2 TaxID=3029425 RepID=A0ABT6Y0B8_ALISE|nr:anthranilate phosphoribosyltransferase [Alicyclobacillus sendaiensis]MDI9260773.1 anthranilate phosphoribosyltransferase [Alicyclobacillus sendaiensis PA2]